MLLGYPAVQFLWLGILFWLVVWNMTFIFPSIGNFIIRIDYLFSGFEATNQNFYDSGIQTASTRLEAFDID